MSDPNPYEPPQTPESLTTGQVVKRGLGVVAILLLTPVAVIIAGSLSCLVSTEFSTGELIPNGMELAVFIVPPSIVLLAMVLWALRAHRREQRSRV